MAVAERDMGRASSSRVGAPSASAGQSGMLEAEMLGMQGLPAERGQRGLRLRTADGSPWS